jgi:hypothetical protein
MLTVPRGQHVGATETTDHHEPPIGVGHVSEQEVIRERRRCGASLRERNEVPVDAVHRTVEIALVRADRFGIDSKRTGGEREPAERGVEHAAAAER